MRRWESCSPHPRRFSTARASEGRTLLDLACRAATGDIAIPLNPGTPEQHAAVDLILNAGADPSAADQDNWSPLHTAAMPGHRDLARRLVAAGASVESEAYGKEGASPLSYALFYAKAYMGARCCCRFALTIYVPPPH